MMHTASVGGGEQGSMFEYQYKMGWFGDMKGIKYVFPTTVLAGNVWYYSFKNGCGLLDDCACKKISHSRVPLTSLLCLLAHHSKPRICASHYVEPATLATDMTLMLSRKQITFLQSQILRLGE